MLAHPEASRAAQSAALGRTERQLREMQTSVNVRQQARVVEARVPRNEAESLELAPHLWSREDDAPKHHWRGPGGVYRWQDTNYYSGGLAVDLGLKRSGYINAQKDRISEDRVNEGTRAAECPAVTCDPVECPKRFQDAAQADKYQARHRDRQAKIHVGRMPRAHLRRSATDRERNVDGFDLSYSYRAQFEGKTCPAN
jgi:hypothetical protein